MPEHGEPRKIEMTHKVILAACGGWHVRCFMQM